MRQPEKYFCDICKDEIAKYQSEKYYHAVPVIVIEHETMEEVAFVSIDVCKVCMFKVTSIKCDIDGQDIKLINNRP